ncbi:MAG TPA: hypothetical protein VFJ43_05310, partial [Bacteroidia bacterium]|nr:hypothetical protein [Bacteroidia bacterium]
FIGVKYMNFKKIISEFIIVFIISLLVTLVVSFLWNLVFHGIGRVDWETSFRFAIVLGIIIPIIDSRKKTQ